MTLEQVGTLIAYVILGILAGERAWSIFKVTPKQNGTLHAIQKEVEELRRKVVEGKLEDIIVLIKDNHEDLASLREESNRSHVDIIEKVRTLVGGK